MIAEGAHLLAAKERLGHSSIQVTADRYGHLFPSLEEALTDRVDASYCDALSRFSSPVIARISHDPPLSTETVMNKRRKNMLRRAKSDVPPGRFELPAYRLGGGRSIP